MSEERKTISVLIVEDDPVQSDLLRDGLELEGDIVCCAQARDGVEALSAIKKYEPMVMLLDLAMPQMDGLDLLRELQKDQTIKRPHIIVLSVFNQPEYFKKAYALGADDYLIKPYRFDLVANRVRMAVEKKREEKPLVQQRPDLPDPTFVSHIVAKMGATTGTLGFLYLSDAIYIVIHQNGVCIMSKDIYQPLAAHYSTTPQCVEKAMRSVIKEIFAINSTQLHETLKIGNQEDKTHMPNRQFLTLAAQGVLTDYLKERILRECPMP